MRKALKLIILLSGLYIIISCGRQINCPDFNQEILEWIPYQNNDTIRLKNSSNDLIMKLAIDKVIIEHTTHYLTNLDCGGCDDNIHINEYESGTNGLYIDISVRENNIIAHRFLIKDVYFTEYSNEYSEQSNYIFDGVNYEEVWIFEKTDKSKEYIKLIVAKGFGIIGLVDTNGNDWKIIDSNLKSDDSESIEIENIFCE